jgi:hypothetical protein
MHYAIETEHQTKSSASMRTHESPHIKPKETQMAKQTYALTSGGLYDNGQATLFFLLLIITITITTSGGLYDNGQATLFFLLLIITITITITIFLFLFLFFFFPPIISGPLSINA